MDKAFSSDCVDLAEACKVLVKSQSVQAILQDALGSKDYPKALEMMKSGDLTGHLGASIHDLFLDKIQNDATVIWSGLIHQEHDDYPVTVNEYHGVFWVWALESEPVSYFLDSSAAVAFARANWESVYEDGEEPEDEGSEDVHCPFCHTTDSCEHLLLVVDQTFRQAEGGVLYKAFNSRWNQVVHDAEDSDFDERELFEELLQEVDSLSEAEETASPDTVPGMSSTYSYYYCSSEEKTQAALKQFMLG